MSCRRSIFSGSPWSHIDDVAPTACPNRLFDELVDGEARSPRHGHPLRILLKSCGFRPLRYASALLSPHQPRILERTDGENEAIRLFVKTLKSLAASRFSGSGLPTWTADFECGSLRPLRYTSILSADADLFIICNSGQKVKGGKRWRGI